MANKSKETKKNLNAKSASTEGGQANGAQTAVPIDGEYFYLGDTVYQPEAVHPPNKGSLGRWKPVRYVITRVQCYNTDTDFVKFYTVRVKSGIGFKPQCQCVEFCIENPMDKESARKVCNKLNAQMRLFVKRSKEKTK